MPQERNLGDIQAIAQMIDSQAVTRCAWQMLRAHSDEALMIAKDTAAKLDADGDAHGHELWSAVAIAIEKMNCDG